MDANRPYILKRDCDAYISVSFEANKSANNVSIAKILLFDFNDPLCYVYNSRNETIFICNHTLILSIQHREEYNKKFYI